MDSPKSSMGSRRVVETSAVVWMDLLGYGSMLIRAAGFDPTEELAQSAIDRLNNFQDCVADHSSKLMPSVVMNDGAIIYSDLSSGGPEGLFAGRENVVEGIFERLEAVHSQVAQG